MEKLERYVKSITLRQCENIDKDKLLSVLDCDEFTINNLITILHKEKVLKFKYSFDCPKCCGRNTVLESQTDNGICQLCGANIDIDNLIKAASVRLMLNKDDFYEFYNEIREQGILQKTEINNVNKIIEYKKVEEEQRMNKSVFIVHGHDTAAKETVARTLEKLGFNVIILHEQPNSGLTIIEKIDKYAKECCYAIILYTECDRGRDKNAKPEDEKYRARQNVVFEHGYLMATLGRDHVSALVKGEIEKPGDIDGVIYIDMDSRGAWKSELCKNMLDVGLNVNANDIL